MALKERFPCGYGVCDSVSSSALKSIFLLNGERGCGKSTLVAEWLRIFRANNPEVMVVSYFVGSSGRSSDIMTFMRYCITELQGRYFGIQNEDFYSHDNICDMWSFPLVVEAFVASLTLKPCVLLLDGAEELSAIHGLPSEQAKGFTWLPSNLPNHCKIILTTTASHLSYKYIKERCDVHIADILKISDESTRLSIFQKQLPTSDRFIPTEQLKEILNHKRKVSPLQLAVLASELSSCGIYTNKLDCLENYLDTLSMEQLWSLVIQRWAVDYSWACERKEKKKNRSSITELHGTVMEGWVVDVLCLLCISRCGLSDHDILQLLKLMGYRQHLEVTPLHWASFRAATSKWIQEKPDGLLHICHRYIRDVIEHLLLGAVIPINESLDNSINKSISRKRKRIHQLLIKYFLQLDFSRRVYEELPWHLVMIGNTDELHRFLSDTRTVDLISRNMSYGCQMKMELIHYWQILSSSGKEPAAEYQMTTSEITEGGNNLYRILFFVAQCLKDFGKIKEAENVFLSIESHLITSMYEKSKMEVLLWTQKYLGDLCCEVGSLQDAYMYYKKALANLQSLGPGDLENKKLLKFKGPCQKSAESVIPEELFSALQLDPQATKDIRKSSSLFVVVSGRLMCHLAVLDARMFPGQSNKMLEDTIRHYELFQPTPYEQATIKLAQGLNKFSDGDFSKAEKYFSECLDIRCKLYGKKHILCGEVQECLADLENQKRNNQYSHRIRALNYYTAVIEIKVAFEALTKSVSAKQNLQLSLSNTLLKAGKLLNQTDFGGSKEAIGLLQRSLDLRTSVVGHDHHLSLEVQSILKEVKSASPINKEHFGYQQFNSIQRPKSVQHYKRFDNFLSIINNHDTTLNKAPALNNINSLNQTDGAKDFLSQCSINQEHSMQTLLSTRNIMCVHGKSSLLYKEEKKNPQKAETIPVSQALTLSGRKPTSERIAIVFRPASVYSASMTGPLSTIASLAPLNRPKSSSDIDKFIHKAAWYHVPGRYTTLDVSFPPKRNQLRNKAKMI
ncbi:tetratricopeptide repeat protein 41-like [Bombina bombina]|uniref:tetratricopeptide repeat protein 41-like n=1 Tax=Bombina bombina TaxID=8345 RepID=UPI00235B146E|nr:tetratricopeptide repeat protein 41-like [Bombina bombina]